MEGRFVLSVLIIPLLFSSVSFAESEGAMEEENGELLDVLVIDLHCDENETCVNRPSHFVEYFGADWCTECPRAEAILRETNSSDILIMSHKPSNWDDFWLEESRYKFIRTYQLWGYPSVIVDGSYLLAGPTQTQELGTLISGYDTNYTGISSVSLENNSLILEGDFDNLTIDVWTVESNEKLTNVALNHTNLSNSTLVDINGDKLIITLSVPGTIEWAPGSTLPANDYIPYTNFDLNDEKQDHIKGSTVVIITVLLLMITLPSTIQLFNAIRKNDDYSYEEE